MPAWQGDRATSAPLIDQAGEPRAARIESLRGLAVLGVASYGLLLAHDPIWPRWRPRTRQNRAAPARPVLDTSAVLAWLRDDPGGEVVDRSARTPGWFQCPSR